jgi:leucyl/phenylalanyl-tRNA--protein transferase
MPVFWLEEDEVAFPPVEMADPSGLLAIGGDLSSERILAAYKSGIFPWFNEMDPYLWWAPDPRFVLFPSELKVAKSMRPYFNQGKFQVTFDLDFPAVIQRCAEGRKGPHTGTWITDEMIDAYVALHEQGYAHSVEVWQDGYLAGGLYGVSLGKIFFGESMFARVGNASKFGFITLVRTLQENGFGLIDCQQETEHLGSLGARAIPRAYFTALLKSNEAEPTIQGNWGSLIQN